MQIETLDEIQLKAMGQGMSDYHLFLCQALLDYQPALKQLALMLKEMGYMHECSEPVLTLTLLIDEAIGGFSL